VDFIPTDEQRMVSETMSKLSAAGQGARGRKDDLRALHELGVFGLAISDEFGGSGGGPVDVSLAAEALGFNLIGAPYVSTAVVAVFLIQAHGTDVQKQELLPAIISGALKIGFAVLEPSARYDLEQIRTIATARDDMVLIEGSKCGIVDADDASLLIVSARSGTDAPNVVSLFLVSVDSPGVAMRSFPSLDGRAVADVELVSVTLKRDAVLGKPGGGAALLEQAIDHGLVALCAEAVGLMSRLTAICGQYASNRRQFGQPIGRFQAIEHKLADMITSVEQCRSVTYAATAALSSSDQKTRRRTVSAAKSLIGRRGRVLGQDAIQLHGGIGVTEELEVGNYVKRLLTIDMTWGDASHHNELYAKAM
jgi:alkylation response protein AidB-like acyl-CoA dehydrogenase